MKPEHGQTATSKDTPLVLRRSLSANCALCVKLKNKRPPLILRLGLLTPLLGLISLKGASLFMLDFCLTPWDNDLRLKQGDSI
jgi:hypothetical protein